MRLDVLLVEKHLASSRTQAQKMIRNGDVSIATPNGQHVVLKASENIDSSCKIRIQAHEETRYASRAGRKLAGALRHLNISAAQSVALDVGQSTGGFSDCLLQAGATKVIGIDVGHGQLATALSRHPRLVCIEGVNARYLTRDHLHAHTHETTFDLVVMDVSFISQTLILPRIVPLIKPQGWLVSLVKPQFELDPNAIGKGGLVKDQRHYETVRTKLLRCAEDLDLDVAAYFDSSITGGDGNREFFLGARPKA